MPGNREEAAEIVGPLEGPQVHEQCPGGVGDVGDVPPAAGQVPEQQAVDGPRGKLAGLGAVAGAGDVVEQPGDLGGREVGIEHQAGAFGDPAAAVAVPLAEWGGAAVLPDQGRADRLAGLAVPDDGCLALVGQPDGRDPVKLKPCFGQCPLHLRADRAEEGVGIVLDPARLRVSGKDLGLGLADRLAAGGYRRRPGCWWSPGRSPAGGRVPWLSLQCGACGTTRVVGGNLGTPTLTR